MTQLLRFGSEVFDIESDALQRAITAAPDTRASRPRCICADPPLEMYVSTVNGRHVIKRMPNTAHLHNPTCASYEAPGLVSGIGDVDGKAILHDDESDVVTLKLAYSLSRNGPGLASSAAPSVPDSAKVSVSRLTLRSTMDYLWESAQLNRWHPQMHGRRNYGVIYKYVRRAIENTHAKQIQLAQAIYMPEPFYVAHATDIKVRADRDMERCAFRRSGKQPLMLLFGEVKAVAEARQGVVLQMRHAPFLSFFVPQSLHTRVLRLFDAELALWNAGTGTHLLVLGTFAQNAAGIYEFDELALMVVDEGWIPVRTVPEMTLFARLATEGRAFLKGMRFNVSDGVRLADALLTDTERPTAVYITNGSEDPKSVALLSEQCANTGLDHLFVHAREVGSAGLPQRKCVADSNVDRL